jgi:hypothetical protein
MDLLAGDPRAFGEAVRHSAAVGEKADRALIDGSIHGGHAVLLGAKVDKVRLGYRTYAIHRQHGVTGRPKACGPAPDIDDLSDLAESLPKVSRRSGLIAIGNCLTKGGITNARP